MLAVFVLFLDFCFIFNCLYAQKYSSHGGQRSEVLGSPGAGVTDISDPRTRNLNH